MPFTALDRDTFEIMGFTVGDEAAIRVRWSVRYIIHADGTWQAAHTYNNVYVMGKSRDPVIAYRAAKEALLLKFRELGGGRA